MYTISAVMSLPMNHILMIKYAYLFVEDVWLYNYDAVRYEDTLELVFNVSSLIELMKFRLLDKMLNLLQYQDGLGISNYQPYTRPRFI